MTNHVQFFFECLAIFCFIYISSSLTNINKKIQLMYFKFNKIGRKKKNTEKDTQKPEY